MRLLTDADRIESIAQLVGADSLPAAERISLRCARMLREVVLQQSAVLDNDQYCSPAKQRALLALVLGVHHRLLALLERGVGSDAIDALDLTPLLSARYETPPDGAGDVKRIEQQLTAVLDGISER